MIQTVELGKRGQYPFPKQRWNRLFFRSHTKNKAVRCCSDSEYTKEFAMRRFSLFIGIVLLSLTGCLANAPQPMLPQFDDVIDYERGTIISAMPIKVVEPQYPRQALLSCLGGVVEMVITVDADGLAQEIDVMRAEPGSLFVKAATDAVFQWRFKTPTSGGMSVESLQRLPLEFESPCD